MIGVNTSTSSGMEEDRRGGERRVPDRAPASAPLLSSEEERCLLLIARRTLEEWVRARRKPDLRTFPTTPTLEAQLGAFVTLHAGANLRGCMGSTISLGSLALAVRDNTINAAANDPRFRPVAPQELVTLRIEISVLLPSGASTFPFVRIRRPEEDIELGRDGLYVEKPGGFRGLLLPQVATCFGWDTVQFLRALCRKAGLPEGAWREPDVRLFRFGAQVFGE